MEALLYNNQVFVYVRYYINQYDTVLVHEYTNVCALVADIIDYEYKLILMWIFICLKLSSKVFFWNKSKASKWFILQYTGNPNSGNVGMFFLYTGDLKVF